MMGCQLRKTSLPAQEKGKPELAREKAEGAFRSNFLIVT
jgi:hypothetical protein